MTSAARPMPGRSERASVPDDGEGSLPGSRLERVESVLAIQDLKARYAELVDRRYRDGQVAEPSVVSEAAEAAARLFTEDATWDGGPRLGRVVGRAAIAERLRQTTLRFARHYFVAPRIVLDDRDPGRARGRWELLSPCRDRKGRDFWLCGVEEDEYERVGGAWLHRSMSMTPVVTAPSEGPWTIHA